MLMIMLLMMIMKAMMMMMVMVMMMAMGVGAVEDERTEYRRRFLTPKTAGRRRKEGVTNCWGRRGVGHKPNSRKRYKTS